MDKKEKDILFLIDTLKNLVEIYSDYLVSSYGDQTKESVLEDIIRRLSSHYAGIVKPYRHIDLK